MTGAGVRRRVLPAVLLAVLLVTVQFFAHGVNEPTHGAESRIPPATAPYAHCGDDTHPEETSERFRARGRPLCRDLTPDTTPHLQAHAVTPADDGTPARRPVAAAHHETRPAGRELPALLQVFRC
ncbi:hypothetical protein GCM10009837_23020 [Streptomyces durmitorensis]|uniref:Secreted protein n=1 Tax=Streptomyces durmitorensis TaxID=319947 RepID=A0ABY4PNV5_9ACTN|nr:hypothetical protein [Streptomyces durmitorensis]UQT55070.1 hypothetical protein M4V62_08165 [Streptomyces durmitorensis]